MPGDLLHPLAMANLRHRNNPIFSKVICMGCMVWGIYPTSSTQRQYAYYPRAPAFETSDRIPTGLRPASQNCFRWSPNLLWGETRKKSCNMSRRISQGPLLRSLLRLNLSKSQSSTFEPKTPSSPMRLPIFVGKNPVVGSI